MHSPLCATLGIAFPLFAFSHCRDVVAAVSKAGGFGVFGAGSSSPEELEIELRWIDAHVDGRPYGVDLLIPENLAIRTEAGTSNRDLMARIPNGHQAFVRDLLARHGVDPDRALTMPNRRTRMRRRPTSPTRRNDGCRLRPSDPAGCQRAGRAAAIHARPRAPPWHPLRRPGRRAEMCVRWKPGWISWSPRARPGGHCGEVSTLVLIPEVLRAIKGLRPVPGRRPAAS